MPTFSIISEVSEVLQNLLDTGFQQTPVTPNPFANVQVQVNNLMAPPSGQPPVVTIFLYELLEDPASRNRPDVRPLKQNGTMVRKPDLTLLLRYLITPWLDNHNRPYTDQIILGRIAQIMYERAILQGPNLAPTALAKTAEALKVTMTPITLEDRTRIWNSLQQKYRVSLTYEVRVASIEPYETRQVPLVHSRTLDFQKIVGDGS